MIIRDSDILFVILSLLSCEHFFQSRSRSPGEKDDHHGSQSTLQRIKNRFRSKSADRARDHREPQVTPILVGHSTSGQEDDPSLQQYSETCV